jgi:peptidoglycan/LPS O-acetylase OafA/YrhL
MSSDAAVLTAPAESPAVAPVAAAAAPRYEFLDGLRGLAALYVTVHHAMLVVFGELPQYSLDQHRWAAWLVKGHYAVAVFIVLSGFCLMLPVAKARGGELRGGLRGYVKRRARRILPAYYAAFVVSLLMIAFIPAMARAEGVFWNMSLPAFEPGAVISHLTLTHNLNPAWVYKVNSPLWSVATEWQIYFLLPLVLLPVWRRWGAAAMAGAGVAIGVGIHLARGVLPVTLTQACPWYIGLFAMGAAAATLGRGGPAARLVRRLALPGSLGLFGLIVAAMAVTGWDSQKLMPFDLAVGAATALLLAALAALPAEAGAVGGVGRAIRAGLESRPLRVLGSFSYSLYLMHVPLLVLFYRLTPFGGWGWRAAVAAALGLGVPLAAAGSYGFYWLFERPFLDRGRAAGGARSPICVPVVSR